MLQNFHAFKFSGLRLSMKFFKLENFSYYDMYLYSADVDYDSNVIDVMFNVGDSRVTVAINITDDNVDEGDEVFGLDLKRTDGTPDTVQITGLTTAFGIIEDNDEPGMYVPRSYIEFRIYFNYRSTISE